MINFSNLLPPLEFFLKYKRGLKASEGEFIYVEPISCITVRDFWST